MKRFYNRDAEICQLRDMQQQSYEDYSRFVVLTGRRRVGKTSLVYRLMEETKDNAPGLYFFVGRKTETALVRTFCDEVRNKLQEFVPESIVTFRELMQFLLEIGKRRKFTLFIDEFQEFDNVNAGVFSDIQELWDKYKKETNAFWPRRLHPAFAAIHNFYNAGNIKRLQARLYKRRFVGAMDYNRRGCPLHRTTDEQQLYKCRSDGSLRMFSRE